MRRDLAAAGFGTPSLSTPSGGWALTRSACTPPGRTVRYSNRPVRRVLRCCRPPTVHLARDGQLAVLELDPDDVGVVGLRYAGQRDHGISASQAGPTSLTVALTSAPCGRR
jgi:hypothetical protein